MKFLQISFDFLLISINTGRPVDARPSYDRPVDARPSYDRPVDGRPPYDRPTFEERPFGNRRPISPGPDGPIYDSFGGIGPIKPLGSR